MKTLVKVIQYKLPHGMKVEQTTELNGNYKNQYDSLSDHNCKIEAEILTTGQVSITINNGEQDLDIRIVKNGPQVQQAIIDMLTARLWENQVHNENL